MFTAKAEVGLNPKVEVEHMLTDTGRGGYTEVRLGTKYLGKTLERFRSPSRKRPSTRQSSKTKEPCGLPKRRSKRKLSRKHKRGSKELKKACKR